MRIRLAAHNEAFLDYMTQPLLPAHLLAGKDLAETGFFRRPIGTGAVQNRELGGGQGNCPRTERALLPGRAEDRARHLSRDGE